MRGYSTHLIGRLLAREVLAVPGFKLEWPKKKLLAELLLDAAELDQ